MSTHHAEAGRRDGVSHAEAGRRGGMSRAKSLSAERIREICSAAGKASVANLTPGQLSARMRRAVRARWARVKQAKREAAKQAKAGKKGTAAA